MTQKTTTALRPKTFLPVISSGRLKCVGGEKGSPGCQRKYAAAYFFNAKQGGSAATRLGSALHAMAEVYQETGEIPDPESPVAEVFRAGAHKVQEHGKLLVEYEHVGELPDGTPFLAYIDGHGERGDEQGVIVVQDLKTTSAPRWALNDKPKSHSYLGQDLQAMLYGWIIACSKHLFCKQLPPDHVGPKHWQVWDPDERNARVVLLRWLYFLTRGKPDSWDVCCQVPRVALEVFMQERILPLVAKINALHLWRERNESATIVDGLDDILRTTAACDNVGKWCGAWDEDACSMSCTGTPIEQLLTTGRKPPMTAKDTKARLAALRAKTRPTIADGPPSPAAPAPEPPAPEPPAPEPPAEDTKKRRRVRKSPPKETPAAAAGETGVNPPESTETLAARAAVPAPELEPMTRLQAAISALRELGFEVTLHPKAGGAK